MHVHGIFVYLSFAKGRVDFVSFYIEAGFCRGLQLADGNLPAFTQRGDFLAGKNFVPGREWIYLGFFLFAAFKTTLFT